MNLGLKEYAILGLIIGLLVNFVALPAAGYSIHTVQGDSMEPRLYTCDMVLVDTDKDTVGEVSEDDIIVYEKSDQKIIHKVVNYSYKNYKKYAIFTKGINNNSIDPYYIYNRNVIGVAVLKIPFSVFC